MGTDPATRFTALAREVATPLRRYVQRRVPPAAVDDVVADVFLVLWRRLADVPSEAALPWAYGVARRCVANAQRSEHRQRRLVDRIAAVDPPEPVLPLDEGLGEARADTDPEVHAALASLGSTDREVVMLWAWEGLGPKEIAVVTGLTPNAVSIRLHRAKKALAARLRKTEPPAGQEPSDGRRPR